MSELTGSDENYYPLGSLVGPEAINDPAYWRKRIEDATKIGLLHQSIFKCSYDTWLGIQDKQATILSKHIKPGDSILDVGCGYGRLLWLLPYGWIGEYMGIDISEDFLQLASIHHPGRSFVKLDITNPTFSLPDKMADWTILVSMKHMIIRNLGNDVWEKAEENIRRVSKKTLYMEYDVNDPGTVVINE